MTSWSKQILHPPIDFFIDVKFAILLPPQEINHEHGDYDWHSLQEM